MKFQYSILKFIFNIFQYYISLQKRYRKHRKKHSFLTSPLKSMHFTTQHHASLYNLI